MKISPLGENGLSTWSRRNSFTYGLQASFIVLLLFRGIPKKYRRNGGSPHTECTRSSSMFIKYVLKRVVSGRRCLLLVIKQTNICLPEVVNGYLWLQITDINFNFGSQIKRFQKPHSLQSVSSSLVLTIHAFHSLFATCLNVPLLLYLTST